MAITFFKYHGTGNDFVLIDNRDGQFPKDDRQLVARMCARRFGIGADGLILLENHPTLDFKMIYYNSDGNIGSMCGNGGRCVVHFARYIGLIESEAFFEAADGHHQATLSDEMISLKMGNVQTATMKKDSAFINTGSPHHVEMVENLGEYDVFKKGKSIRDQLYGADGANINFVEQVEGNTFAMRTYERGVEAETYSCGTGATAVALAMFSQGKTQDETVTLNTLGGPLRVRFKKTGTGFSDIYLEGPATMVYKGVWK